VALAIFVGGRWPVWSGEFIWSLVFTLIAASVVASFLWLYVLQEMPASIAGLGTMGTPVVGLLASWAQLHERPTALEIVGMVVILVGMGILFARGAKSAASKPARVFAPTGEEIALDDVPGR
jgi:drug/metabolite transporter (DMT)-like permease